MLVGTRLIVLPGDLRAEAPRHPVGLDQAVLAVHRVHVQVRLRQVTANLLDLVWSIDINGTFVFVKEKPSNYYRLHQKIYP